MRINGFWLGLSVMLFIMYFYWIPVAQIADDGIFKSLIVASGAIISMYLAFPEDKETKKK